MKNTTRVGIVLALSIAFFSAEISALQSSAIAFTAAYLQERGQHTDSFTYAFHRAELVGAFFNGVFLLALALSICLQSLERFVNVEVVDSPKLVLIIGCVGLGLNILSAIVVHDHHGHGHGTAAALNSVELRDMNAHRDQIVRFAILSSRKHCRRHDDQHATHNHRLEPPTDAPQHNLGLIGVLTHLLGDAVNNIGVIIAAIIFMKLSSPKRFYADPAVSLAISFIIFGGSIPMTLKTGRILLEASPKHLDLADVKKDLLSVPDVLSIHDLHVWHLSQSVILASLHVCIPVGTSIEQWETTERYLQQCFEEYGVNHVTISPEIEKDPETVTQATENIKDSCKMPSHNDFGCAVGELRKRKAGA
ncbi:hypothetical protein CVT26_014210 [Gymnopilus dilepis]|uniref:Cation efflux protein cytoplasmic domain-containing protein n=1 Tax=Gymnopilus dilepis TaxID=231916 RepID=A0A409VUA2_9AGAR|nr:hypothetical protein CVT26_014210 [Gymnopilus dilepis]